MITATDERRADMVERQIALRGVRNADVLAAMRSVPREAFVGEALAEFAYDDSPLPIEAGQTISQPYIVAAMIEAAEVKPGDRVLEIGAGSGYAAAVMSRIAGQVVAIERHADLAAATAERLARLGYDNVQLRTGDGSDGWAEEGPFDAILVAAASPRVPEPLKRQLKIRGTLVIPVGSADSQRLVRITRTGEDSYHREELGDVRFVPLIGAHGWAEDEGTDSLIEAKGLPAMIAAAAEPLPDIDDPAFGALFDRFAEAKVVLLGEASHGTSEFYAARAAITRRLVERHDFTIVAVEADWPDAAQVDRYVRQKPPRAEPEPPFQRFPTWMWRNTDVAGFLRWLRTHNAERPAERRAGFYGLDLYNLGGSIRAVIDYLDRVDPQAAAIARERYGCLTPWSRDPASYGRMALTSGYSACEAHVVSMLTELLRKQGEDDEWLDAAQNARLVANAEAYYRAMYYGAAESWNLRDTHMFETLDALLEAKGEQAKAVVWAHNSHIGDARATEMGQARGELNIGQLCRQAYGDKAVLIGFGTHGGTVAAASDWDAPMQVMRVNPSRPDSVERLAHDSGVPRFVLDFARGGEALRDRLAEPRLKRFIGVIYRPDTERWSHYAEAALSEQFDAFVWFDETNAIEPLPAEQEAGAAETYPFGL